MSKLVYLYGPISGKTFGEANDWRDWMRAQLKPFDIEAISPLRFKDYLANLKGPVSSGDDTARLSGHGREYADLGVLSTPPAVLARDKFDVHRVQMLAGNFMDASQVSIGSMFEQAWAHAKHTPVAAAVPRENGHPHDHMFFSQTVDFKVHSLEALRDIIIAVLHST